MKRQTVHVLTRCDARPIPEGRGEIRVFCKIYNELVRLPYLLEYYRKLGVARFIFTDNDSSDGSRDYLQQQPDCHVFHTSDSFSDSASGVDWQNRVLDLYGTGHWCLIVDSDEFLVYPHVETMGLPLLTRYLDAEGAEGLYTFMLDMYPEGEMAKAVYSSGKNPLDICPMFDADYQFVRRPFIDMIRFPNRPPPFPEMEVIGGPRARLFYPEQNSARVWPRVKPRLLGIPMRFLSKLGLVSEDSIPHMASILFKVPLVKWRQGLAYFSATHVLTPVKLAAMTGVLLHFKFFSDFHDQAVLHAARGQHDGGGRQYRLYARKLEEKGGATVFRYAGSVKYRNSADLITRKLMKSAPSFETFAAAEGTHAKRA